MGDFDAFADAGEQDGVVTHDVAGADGLEADGLAVALAGVAFTAVNGAFLQVAPQGRGHHLAHAQGSARGGVHLVAVMRFDDLDVHLVAQHAGGQVEQLEGEIDAHAHVRGEHNGDVFGGLADSLLAGIVKAGGADDHGLAGPAAHGQVVEGDLGAGEIDQHIEGIEHRTEIFHHLDTVAADAGQLARVGADHATARALDGGTEGKAFDLLAGFDQGPAHASGGAGHGNSSHCFSASCFVETSRPEAAPATAGRLALIFSVASVASVVEL